MRVRPLPRGVRATRASRLANRLNSAAIHLLRRIAVDDGADGLTAARLSVLSLLVFGGEQSLGTLARQDGVAVPTMSRLVDGLVDHGLVARRPAATDRRALRIEAPPAGRDLLERARARRVTRLARDVRTLAEREIAALERAVAVLEALERGITPQRPAAAPRARRFGKRGRS